MKLEKISLNRLSKAEMEKKEQNMLRGGNSCTCVCHNNCTCKYAGDQEGPNDSYYGGSSTYDNGSANNQNLFDNAFEGAAQNGGYYNYGYYSY